MGRQTPLKLPLPELRDSWRRSRLELPLPSMWPLGRPACIELPLRSLWPLGRPNCIELRMPSVRPLANAPMNQLAPLPCHELRTELNRITTAPTESADWPPEKIDAWMEWQIDEIAALKKRWDHNIEIFERASSEVNGNAYVNCFMYALRIEPVQVNNVCSQEIFPDSAFVAWSIDNLLQQNEVNPQDTSHGDVAIYFDNAGKPTHAARNREGRFISKWGGRSVLAHVWRHGAYEVPGAYGDDIRFFQAVSKEDAIQAYRDWARRNGLTSEEHE